MMMHAYDQMYLNKTSRMIGNMLHDAVIEYGFDGTEFLKRFIQSGIAEEVEHGNPKYLAGKSGQELMLEVSEITAGESPEIVLIETFQRSDVYWAGWILARYQWYSGKSFSEILRNISFEDFINMYETLHEADVSKAYDTIDFILLNKESALKKIRKMCRLTQEELAEQAEVSVNTIRAYERGSKDIGKAQIDTLMKMAFVLKCDVKDLL